MTKNGAVESCPVRNEFSEAVDYIAVAQLSDPVHFGGDKCLSEYRLTFDRDHVARILDS